MSKRSNALFLSTALLVASASPVLAQDSNTGDLVDVTTNDTIDSMPMNIVDETTTDENKDDDSGKWGLLGLLGLAGLLGLKRRDHDNRLDSTTGGPAGERR